MAGSPATPTWAFEGRRLPLRTPYRWAKGTQTERHIGLVCHEGIGWGEAAPPPHETWRDAAFADLIAALPADADLRGLDALPARLRCGASTAWMATQATSDRVSLATWLGERSDRRPHKTVAVNMLLTAVDPEQLRHEAAAAVNSGYTTIKLKVGSGDDLARVAAVRAGAPRAALRLDANGAWTPAEARAMLDALASFEIAYVEQPVAPAHEEALRAMTGGDIPIALDESATDAATIQRLRTAGIGDAFILKPQRLGGLDRTLDALDAAAEIPATITNSLESAIGVTATLHVAALLPAGTACGLATSRYLERDVAPPPAIHDGHMRVPAGPGLGVAPKGMA